MKQDEVADQSSFMSRLLNVLIPVMLLYAALYTLAWLVLCATEMRWLTFVPIGHSPGEILARFFASVCAAIFVIATAVHLVAEDTDKQDEGEDDHVHDTSLKP